MLTALCWRGGQGLPCDLFSGLSLLTHRRPSPQPGGMGAEVCLKPEAQWAPLPHFPSHSPRPVPSGRQISSSNGGTSSPGCPPLSPMARPSPTVCQRVCLQVQSSELQSGLG